MGGRGSKPRKSLATRRRDRRIARKCEEKLFSYNVETSSSKICHYSK